MLKEEPRKQEKTKINPFLLAKFADIVSCYSRKICRDVIVITYRHKVLRSLVSELPPNAQPLCLTCSVEPFSALENSSTAFRIKLLQKNFFSIKWLCYPRRGNAVCSRLRIAKHYCCTTLKINYFMRTAQA